MVNYPQEKIMELWHEKNTDNPLVSIKCMTYNHENFISQCLDGFLMQKTTFPFEILVHDDCSTDNTTNIVLEYAKNYPKIIKPILEDENQYSKHDGSHHKKIDAMIKGKYIAVCEGDDYWIDENKLQIQCAFLENNPDYGLVYTATYVFDQTKNKIISTYGKETNFEQLIKESNNIRHLTTCYRTDLYFRYIKDIQPSEKGWLMGDYPTWIYMAYYSKIKYINKITSVYRVLPNSSCHFTDIDKYIKFYKSVYDIKFFFQDFFNIKSDLKWDESIYYVPKHFNAGHRKELKNYSLPVSGKKNKIILKISKCPVCFYIVWFFVKVYNHFLYS